MDARGPTDAQAPAGAEVAALDEQRRRWADGTVAWSSRGLSEAISEGPRPERGTPAAAVAAAQVLWLVDRYGREVGPAHAVRLEMVRRFLVEHRGVLTEAGLCHNRPGECCEKGSLSLTPGLTHALATLAYAAKTWDGGAEAGEDGGGAGARGAWVASFDLAQVLGTALAYDDGADGK